MPPAFSTNRYPSAIRNAVLWDSNTWTTLLQIYCKKQQDAIVRVLSQKYRPINNMIIDI